MPRCTWPCHAVSCQAVLCLAMPGSAVPCHTVPCNAMLDLAMPYCARLCHVKAVPCNAMLDLAVPCPTVLCNTVPGCAVPGRAWLCHAMPHQAMLCHTMLCHATLNLALLCLAAHCHTILCYALPCHAMLCLVMPSCAMLCYAWLHIAVPYHAVSCGARALLTRLGGRCGAEQVATSRSHWRVSSSQHPSGDPGDREHAGARGCSPGHCGWPSTTYLPSGWRRWLPLCPRAAAPARGQSTGSHIITGCWGHVPSPRLPGLTVRLRCGVPSTARRLSAAQHRGGSASP